MTLGNALSIVVVLALAAFAAGPAPPSSPGETGILFRGLRVAGKDRAYAVYIPRDYDPAKKWPVVVFLHGRGECGIEGIRQLSVGLAPAILGNPAAWPVIAVFPQVEPNETWVPQSEYVLSALDAVSADYSVDPDRVYLTGLSLGGQGTWAIASEHPGRWAAIAPICARKAGDPKSLAALPIWAFHGEKDSVIAAAESREMVGAINAAGGRAQLTLYPDLDHNSWDRAYRDPAFPEWLLSHARGAPKP